MKRPQIIGELIVVLVLLRAYDLVRGHAELRQAAALRHGEQLLNVERWLHINVELSVNLWTAQQSALSLLASYWYQFAHLSVTLGVLVWCWWRRAHSYRRARNALVLTNVFGLVIFLIFPAAPPRFLPGFGFVDAVARAGFGTSHGGPVTADQFGAFPSLHLAWAVWTAVVAHRLVRSTVLRRLWLCYPLITATVVVATGNHYLLDVLAGSLIALTTLAIAYRIPSRRSRDPHHRHDEDSRGDHGQDKTASELGIANPPRFKAYPSSVCAAELQQSGPDRVALNSLAAARPPVAPPVRWSVVFRPLIIAMLATRSVAVRTPAIRSVPVRSVPVRSGAARSVVVRSAALGSSALGWLAARCCLRQRWLTALAHGCRRGWARPAPPMAGSHPMPASSAIRAGAAADQPAAS